MEARLEMTNFKLGLTHGGMGVLASLDFFKCVFGDFLFCFIFFEVFWCLLWGLPPITI